MVNGLEEGVEVGIDLTIIGFILPMMLGLYLLVAFFVSDYITTMTKQTIIMNESVTVDLTAAPVSGRKAQELINIHKGDNLCLMIYNTSSLTTNQQWGKQLEGITQTTAFSALEFDEKLDGYKANLLLDAKQNTIPTINTDYSNMTNPNLPQYIKPSSQYEIYKLVSIDGDISGYVFKQINATVNKNVLQE